MSTSYPLQWPDGWKRTERYRRGRARYKVTGDQATRHLLHELELLGAHRRTRRWARMPRAWRVGERMGELILTTTAAEQEKAE